MRVNIDITGSKMRQSAAAQKNRTTATPAPGHDVLHALACRQELQWLFAVIEARMRLHFAKDCPHASPQEIAVVELPDGSSYARLVSNHGLDWADRVVLALGLAVQVRPHLLDVFFTRNTTFDREFTEFGGRSDGRSKGFIPTGETALFLIAGEDLLEKARHMYLFDDEHALARAGLVTLEGVEAQTPQLSGQLFVSGELTDMLMRGHTTSPRYGAAFPAKRITTQLEWDELVLSDMTMDQLTEIQHWLAYGDKMLNDLGLGRSIKPGFRSLFYGPPGTGKTLAAALLGRICERPVYRVDLSLVVSKYIGETEKNLEGIFSQAERRDWLLFFDEADALFGTRTQINDAHDRFANQEVSYLLQRVEDYPGVVVLATNQKNNLDDAFTRRFQSVVHFAMPDESQRARLWANAFSHRTRLAADVDLERLAAEHELSGGSIVNVVRFATLRALARGNLTITSHDLKEGIRREFLKEGRAL